MSELIADNIKVDTIDTRLDDIITLNASLCATGTIEVEKVVLAGNTGIVFPDGSTQTAAVTSSVAVAKAYISGSQGSPNATYASYGSVTSWTDVSTGCLSITLASDAPTHPEICCTMGHGYTTNFVMCNQSWGVDGDNTKLTIYYYVGYHDWYMDASHFSAVFYW